MPISGCGMEQKMAAGDVAGEQLNFKTFVVRRKAEYSLRFPFLTERQILAKLRKVWKSQKGPAASRGRKREPGMTQGVTNDAHIVCVIALSQSQPSFWPAFSCVCFGVL